MQSIKTIGTILVAVVISVSATLFIGGDTQVIERVTGGAAGPDFSSRIFLRDGVVIGGARTATSSRGAVTYTAASIANSSVIEHNAEAATTATLPTEAALSSLGFLQVAGDKYTMYIHASTTKITLAGGTGTNLRSASTTKDIIASGVARLDFVRLGATEANSIDVLMTTGI